MTPCSTYGQFACDYDTCAKDNFTVSKGKVVLQDYQQKSLGALVTVTTSAATEASISIATSSSTSTSTLPLLTNETANCVNSSSDQSGKLAAVGTGVGVAFAIALAAALVLLGRERRKARRLELENARLGGGGGRPVMVGSAPRRHPNGEAVGNAELMEDRAEYEVMAQPMAHELQTHGG